jgi:hypothetical protein
MASTSWVVSSFPNAAMKLSTACADINPPFFAKGSFTAAKQESAHRVFATKEPLQSIF